MYRLVYHIVYTPLHFPRHLMLAQNILRHIIMGLPLGRHFINRFSIAIAMVGAGTRRKTKRQRSSGQVLLPKNIEPIMQFRPWSANSCPAGDTMLKTELPNARRQTRDSWRAY